MTTYGYCRISTSKQSIDRQVRNIQKVYPNAIIIKEAYTGTTTNRPQWSKLFKRVGEGDTIIFDSVSRMSRNATEGFEIYEILFNRGVELQFIKEPQINTSTYKAALTSGVPLTGTMVDLILDGVNKYLLELAKEQIRLAFEQAQKEVDDLHQRTREGIITAKLNGRQVGQIKGVKLNVKKREPSKQLIKKYSKDFDGNLTDIEVIKLVDISRNTYYRYKKELKASV